MKNLSSSIELTNAQIENITIEFKENQPRVSAKISLCTTGGEKISEFTASTEKYAWENGKEIRLSPALIKKVLSIGREVEELLVEKLNERILVLSEKND